MRDLVAALCSDACAGRATGTEGGRRARGLVVRAFREAGLDPDEQVIPRCNGTNVLAKVPGDVDRWVLVAAHYDHLGTLLGEVYRGADDNAAAVAILVELAHSLAVRPPTGRGVILAAFDAEEPPHFLTEAMGSEHFARHAPIPLDRIDQMVCMDLVGHAVGPVGAPDAVRDSLFALGAERSAETADAVDGIATGEPGVVVRRLDARAVPPMSDYGPFWQRRRPFVFLTAARWDRYHTPRDVPDALAWDKMAATAAWLERFVRQECDRDAEFRYLERTDDLSSLESLGALAEALAPASPEAAGLLPVLHRLRGQVRRDRSLPDGDHAALLMLLASVERLLG